MTRPYSLAFKQKMIERLTGKDAMSASQLSRHTGVRQQNLSRWLEQARSFLLWPRTLSQGGNGPSSRKLGCWPKLRI
jgi:transposase-like protein